MFSFTIHFIHNLIAFNMWRGFLMLFHFPDCIYNTFLCPYNFLAMVCIHFLYNILPLKKSCHTGLAIPRQSVQQECVSWKLMFSLASVISVQYSQRCIRVFAKIFPCLLTFPSSPISAMWPRAHTGCSALFLCQIE